MSRNLCPVCNYSFQPENTELCPACPLNRGCTGVCCPNCGYTSVDIQRSRLARWLGSLLPSQEGSPLENGRQSLAQARSGSRVQVCQFQDLSARQVEKLQAYGLIPGCWVRVMQRKPALVIEVNHTELAIEAPLARGVIVREYLDTA